MTRDELIEDITFAIASNFNEEPISVTKAVLAAIEAAGFKLVRFTETTPPPFNFDEEASASPLKQGEGA